MAVMYSEGAARVESKMDISGRLTGGFAMGYGKDLFVHFEMDRDGCSSLPSRGEINVATID